MQKTQDKEILQQAWIKLAYDAIREEILSDCPPDCLVTYGFPHNRSARGEVWLDALDKPAIFIRPAEWSTPQNTMMVLTHEMIHTITAKEKPDHGPKYAAIASKIGLSGENFDQLMVNLVGVFSRIIDNLPDFPAAPFNAGKPERKKQPTRMLKWVCTCGQIVRAASKDLAAQCKRCDTPFEHKT